MNLLASYKWLQEYVRTKLPPEEFAARLSLSGPSVERSYPQGEHLEKIVVGEVVAVKPHPNADKLRLAETRIGKEIVEIVCGGTNLKEKMKVAVALAGAKVKWHGEGELVELAPTEIRGVKSHGMICAANEIGLYDYFPHAEREILDLTPLESVSVGSPMVRSMGLVPGTPLREALELDDVLFDIEVTTNRPDAFSMVGLAREAAAILDAPFVWKPSSVRIGNRPFDAAQGREKRTELEIKIEAPKLCTRYQAAVMKNVQVKPSPWWMQKRLLAAGIRPISNIVDITNYVMLELGQPMHAFDGDRLQIANSKWQIAIRNAEKGEKMKALDGNTYELDPSMLVIADAKRPIAIAGVMGGEDTGVTRDTTTVIFESATFDPVSVRRTARTLNLHSDSSLRFEKGLSTESTTAALARAVELAQKIAGATLATPLLDRRAAPYKPVSFPWDPEESVRKIGVAIPVPKMKTILTALGFDVQGKGKSYRVRVPYSRDHDIEASDDFTEEIARVYGYHKLPSVMPVGALPLEPEDLHLIWEDRLREAFRGAGFTEVYSYSFVSEELLRRAGWNDAPTLKVQNPLTADLAVMRPALVPSLFQIVVENETVFSEAAIFEIANAYLPRPNDLPLEVPMVAGVVWLDDETGQSFLRAKGVLEALADRFHGSLDFSETVSGRLITVLHPGRRACLVRGGEEIGFIGEVHPAVLERFGIKRRVAVFQFDLAAFVRGVHESRYEPIPAFPRVRRDISFVIPQRTTYAEVMETITSVDPLLRHAELFDVYEGKGIPEGKKSMAFHLTFADPTRTLVGEEVDAAFGRVVGALKSQLDAEVRTS